MKWILKILGLKDDQKPSDLICNQCASFAKEFEIILTDQEWNHVLYKRDKLVESSLGGAYVHKGVLHTLCFLCLFEGLFEAGVELLRINDTHQAKISLEKARKLLPWPTVLYSIGLAYTHLGKMQDATNIWNKAIEDFELRPDLLSSIVPANLPNRSNFIVMTTERIDTTGSLSFGFTNIVDLKTNISKEIEKISR